MNDEDMEQPILTIAIPTYNGAKTIRDMMDRLLEQYDPRVEILVSDNHSTDDTPAIIQHYMKEHPYIKYHRNGTNIGADANFLQCMRMANGRHIYLLSDDDILIENALKGILDYLEKYPDVGLLYLNSVAFHGHYTGVDNCMRLAYAVEPETDLYTSDKVIFMNCAARFWGFMSSFIISKEKFDAINNPEQYYGTYWIQSYIHILCCSKPTDKVGVIKRPSMAAGIYLDVNNFDSGLVNGTNYKKMVDFAIRIGGFNKRQMRKLYLWHLIYLSSHGIIKEKAAGVKKTSYKCLFKLTYMYPSAWFKLYPTFLLPGWLCRWTMSIYRKKKNISANVQLSRQGDVKS